MVKKQRNYCLTNSRKALGLTQKEMAKEIGITPEAYNSYENLKQIPSKKIQERLSEYFIKKGIWVLEDDLFPEQNKFCLEVVSPEEIEKGCFGYCENLALENERKESLKTNLERILKPRLGINKRELEIIRDYYGIGCEKKSTMEIAKKAGKNNEKISEARVGQILNFSIHSLRDYILLDKNKQYFKER